MLSANPKIIRKILGISPLVFLFVLFVQCKSNNKNTGNQQEGNIDFQLVVYDSLNIIKKEFRAANTLPYFKSGKWGYADQEGDIVIPCKFDECGFFNEGITWVMHESKYGFIDSTGKQIIDFMYDGAGDAHFGMLPVKQHNLWGFIDTANNQLISFLYEDYAFSDDGFIHIKQNYQWGTITKKGKPIVQPVYNRDFSFTDGFAIVRRGSDMGVIDTKGQEVIECRYDEIDKIKKDLFIVHFKKSYKEKYLGLIDTSGKIIIPVKYKRLDNVAGQALIAYDGEHCGLLSLANDTLIDFEYENIRGGNTNLLAAKKSKWGYINIQGDSILPFIYDDATGFFNQLAVAGDNGYYGMINTAGQVVVPFKYNEIMQDNGKIIRITERNKYGFYSNTGEQLTPVEFDTEDYHEQEDYTGYRAEPMEFGKFSNGYAIVGKQGKVGIIDEQGKLVIPLNYHHITLPDENGIAIANFKNRKGLVATGGKELTKLKYENIARDKYSGYYYALKKYPVKRGEYTYQQDVKVGYFNLDGKLYGTSAYDSVHYDSEEEIIEKIREAFYRINKDEKNQEAEVRKFDGNLTGYLTEHKFLVKDEADNVNYEYYYDDDLNTEGPFFILKTDLSVKKYQDRFYYLDGKIVRWIDGNGEKRLVADALYAPEEENHLRARRHLIEFRNEEYLKNLENNQLVKKIDNLCNTIDDNISAGMYKKGDSNSESMGEYFHSEDTYFNKNNELIYYSQRSADEAGSDYETRYYNNGKLIREDIGGTVTYYNENNAFRTYRPNAGITEITDH